MSKPTCVIKTRWFVAYQFYGLCNKKISHDSLSFSLNQLFSSLLRMPRNFFFCKFRNAEKKFHPRLSILISDAELPFSLDKIQCLALLWPLLVPSIPYLKNFIWSHTAPMKYEITMGLNAIHKVSFSYNKTVFDEPTMSGSSSRTMMTADRLTCRVTWRLLLHCSWERKKMSKSFRVKGYGNS